MKNRAIESELKKLQKKISKFNLTSKEIQIGSLLLSKKINKYTNKFTITLAFSTMIRVILLSLGKIYAKTGFVTVAYMLGILLSTSIGSSLIYMKSRKEIVLSDCFRELKSVSTKTSKNIHNIENITRSITKK